MMASDNHLRLVKSLIPYKGPIDEDDALLAIELLSRNLGVKTLDHAILYFRKMKEMRIEESMELSFELAPGAPTNSDDPSLVDSDLRSDDESTEVRLLLPKVSDTLTKENEDTSISPKASSIKLVDRMPLPDFIERMKKIPLDCGSVYEDGVMSLCIGDSVYELSKDNVNFIEYTLDNLTIVIHVYYDEEINLWMVSPPEEERSPTAPEVKV
jgi:hypothetical protein